jgi:hypothetical protein
MIIRILIFLLLTFSLSAQVTYSPIDTTYTFGYAHLQSIKNNIEELKTQRSYLEREILLLENIKDAQDLKIRKLEVRDSLYNQEIQLYKDMDFVMRDKMDRASDIMNNYRILLITTEDQLKVETKNARREKLWKSVYKYGYPAAAIIAGIIILK